MDIHYIIQILSASRITSVFLPSFNSSLLEEEANERERQREIEKELERQRKEEEERERQGQRALQQEKRKRRLEYPESAAEVKRLEEMGVERKKRRDDFADSRRLRRLRAAERAMQTTKDS